MIQPPVASTRPFGKKLRLRRKVDRHFTTIAYLTGKWFIIWWFRTPSSGRKPVQTLLIFDYTAPVSAAAALSEVARQHVGPPDFPPKNDSRPRSERLVSKFDSRPFDNSRFGQLAHLRSGWTSPARPDPPDPRTHARHVNLPLDPRVGADLRPGPFLRSLRHDRE